MPVRIRLALHGCTNRPFYHIVVAPSRFKRDGRHLEQIGTYDPLPNFKKEALCSLNVDRIKYWLSVGAQPTTAVYRLLGLAGILPVLPRLYLEAARKREAAAMAAGRQSVTEEEEQPVSDSTAEQHVSDSTAEQPVSDSTAEQPVSDSTAHSRSEESSTNEKP